MTDIRHCSNCGGEYRPHPGARLGLFCSIKCSNTSRKDHSPETAMRRFWAKVDKAPGFGPDGDCWRWTARVDGHGYGEMKIAGQYKKAHRIALFGPLDISNPLLACHRCDNPLCVRPDHLFAGDAKANVQDMIAKGRKPAIYAKREGPSSFRKLSQNEVRIIRASTESSVELAKQYQVTEMVISRARRRLTYRDVA